jgi:hypothetical protein
VFIAKAAGGAKMAIVYDCVCGHKVTTHDERSGKLETCPACRMTVLVPEATRPDPNHDRAATTRGR